MGSHPVNLTVRFLLEITALIAIGYWGWQQSNNLLPQIGLTCGVPLIAAILWGTFNVANDPSRSGKAPVPVPGWLRLTLELAPICLCYVGTPRYGGHRVRLDYGYSNDHSLYPLL